MNKLLITLFVGLFVAQIRTQDLPPFKVNPHEIKGFSSSQEAHMKIALEIFEEVMNDKNFQLEILALERVSASTRISENTVAYNQKYKVAVKDQNYGFSTEYIIGQLFSGREFFDIEKSDNEADIFWHTRKSDGCKGFLFFRKCGIRGSTLHLASRPPKDSDKLIYLNSWFIDDIVDEKQKVHNLVEHIAHEWTHKFGFLDTGREIGDGKFSLFPYVFGRVVEKYAKGICNGTVTRCEPA